MSLTVRPLHPLFAGEATGIDIRQNLTPSDIAEIEAAMDRYAVLVFPGQNITDEEQLAFGEKFGTLETSSRAKHRTRLKSPKIADISNLDKDNQRFEFGDALRMFALGNMLWHTDSSFKNVPAKYSMLSARIIPPTGGETEFADMRAAYDSLPKQMAHTIQGLSAVHSLAQSRAKIGFTMSEEDQAALPPVTWPIVQRHAGSKRKSLYIASHASHVAEWPAPEGKMLLLDLMEHATQREFVYRHTWRLHDLVIWDNRCTMHRGRAYDPTHIRDMRRTTISVDAEERQNIAVGA